MNCPLCGSDNLINNRLVEGFIVLEGLRVSIRQCYLFFLVNRSKATVAVSVNMSDR